MVTITIASPDCAESFFAGRAPRCLGLRRAGSLGELRAVLTDIGPGAGPVQLDLVGHSTRDHHLLRLGSTPIDMLDRRVAGFFRELATDGVLDRLGVGSVRLLSCETAVTDSGQRTLRLLARTLRRPVYGTLVPLLKSHSNAAGFNPAFEHILTESSDLA